MLTLDCGRISAIGVLFAYLLHASPLIASVQATGSEQTSFKISEVGFEKDCTPNPAFTRLLGLIGGDKTDMEVYNAVSGEISGRMFLDDTADWHGLKLSGVSIYHGIERGPVNYIIHFDDTAEKIREVWNEQGWKLPAVNESRDVEGLEGYASIGVSRGGDGGHLGSVTCWRD